MTKHTDKDKPSALLNCFLWTILGGLSILVIGFLLIVGIFSYTIFTEGLSRQAHAEISTLKTKREIDNSLSGWKQELLPKHVTVTNSLDYELNKEHPGFFKIHYTSPLGASIRVYYDKDGKVLASFDAN